MEYENLSFFDAVRILLRISLGKGSKLRRLPKHVQKEMKCQRIWSNARRWKTGRVYPETVEIDSTKEGYSEKDIFSGDVPYSQVSVQAHHFLGEKTPPSHVATLGENVPSSSPSPTSLCPSPEQLRNSRPAAFETCSQLSHTFHRHVPSSAVSMTSNVLTSSISDTPPSGSEEAGSQTEVLSEDDKPLCLVADECAKYVKDIWEPFSKPVIPKPQVAAGDDVNWDAINKARDRVGMLRLDDFRPVKRLGAGATGCVHLAELKGTRCFFAIKAVDKADLIARDKVYGVNTEREILGMMDHPSMPTLYASFQTPSHVCLVTDFCSGGELYETLDKQGGARVPEEAARFFCAEVVLALEYLHRRGVVHRDLKPENILISASGHLILTDFDLSLVASPAPNAGWERQYVGGVESGVGTEEYMAPEMIKGPTHGTPVDWWSFGVLLFEMLYGRTPFVGPTLKETLMNVLRNRLAFPRSVSVSSEAKQLMAALLTKQPEARLGSKMGAIEIRAHPFFAGMDWDNLRRSEVPKLEVPVEYYDPLAACPLANSSHQPDWASGTNEGIALSFGDY